MRYNVSVSNVISVTWEKPELKNASLSLNLKMIVKD